MDAGEPLLAIQDLRVTFDTAAGPVRAVEQTLVLEIAFDAVFPSTRHKSGLAMRFPRVHRIRWDKPAAEADTDLKRVPWLMTSATCWSMVLESNSLCLVGEMPVAAAAIM